MSLVPLSALVRKDLKLFFTDRRSVLLSFVVPIAIASFFGAMFGGAGNTTERARIRVAIVDNDNSAVSRDVATAAGSDPNLQVVAPNAGGMDAGAAEQDVRAGRIVVAVVIPPAFGDAAGAAFFTGREKPAIQLLYDPSHGPEVAMVRGILTEHVMQAVSKAMFGGAQGQAYIDKTLPEVASSNMDAAQKKLLTDMLQSVRRFYQQAPVSSNGRSSAPGLSMPYVVDAQPVTSGAKTPYNGYAHAFGGMAIQFLLFAMANLGIETLVERQRGLWKRLRSAPISRSTLLLAKGLSGTAISCLVLGASFGFAMLMFHVRVQGSVAGFIGVIVASSLMSSAFGLVVAALGKTPAAARGITTLAVLMMVMLGGAWVPTFVFPQWLQNVTIVIPVRWAVDGLDAMTWRGLGLSSAITPIAILLGYTALFGVVSLLWFRWEEV